MKNKASISTFLFSTTFRNLQNLAKPVRSVINGKINVFNLNITKGST